MRQRLGDEEAVLVTKHTAEELFAFSIFTKLFHEFGFFCGSEQVQ